MFANTQMMGMDLGFPDVVLTPPVMAPIPYPNVAMEPMGVPAAYNVLFMGMPAHNLLTTIPLSLGDLPGTTGVTSGITCGPARHLTAAFTIVVGVAPGTRMTSMALQNLTNAPGMRIVEGAAARTVIRLGALGLVACLAACAAADERRRDGETGATRASPVDTVATAGSEDGTPSRARAGAVATVGPEAIAPPATARPSVEPLVQAPPEPALRRDPAAADDVVRALAGRPPGRFGTDVAGVIAHVPTRPGVRTLALTFDLCGGELDRALVGRLVRDAVPATFFASGRFAERHPDVLLALAARPHFTVENHGARHRPCSVRGTHAYGLAGTRDLAAAVREIEDQNATLERLLGRRPAFYRPGTAHLDEACAEAARRLGTPAVGFAVLGDAGGGYGRRKVRDVLVGAPDGAIVLLHANQPASATAEGVADALPELVGRGVHLVRLVDAVAAATGSAAAEPPPPLR